MRGHHYIEPARKPDDGELAILGGGAAGLATAFYAHRAGIPCMLFERSAELGGLCRTFRHGDHRYDSGAHRFHDRDSEVTADVRALLGTDLQPVRAASHIFDRGRLLEFPPSPLAWVRGRGVVEAARVAADVLGSRWRARPERTFEDLATNRYGRRLGKPLLLDYSEKLWGLRASELAPEAASRRLSGLSLSALLIETLRPRRRTAHLDGEFLYPRTGYGAIAEALGSALPRESVKLDHAISGLDCEGGRIRVLRFVGRPTVAVDGRVASTLPLTQLVRFLGDALPAAAHRAAARLRFRQLRLVFLRLAMPRCTASATLYLPDPTLAVSRVTEPKNRSLAMAPQHETALVAEVPCATGDALHALRDDDLAARVIDELAGVGLITPASVIAWEHRRLANAYPVYGLDYREHVDVILRAVAGIENLDVLGRNGLFWYSHLHDQLRSGKNYARSLAAEARDRPSISAHIRKSASTL